MPDTAVAPSFKPTQRTRVRRVHERGRYQSKASLSAKIAR